MISFNYQKYVFISLDLHYTPSKICYYFTLCLLYTVAPKIDRKNIRTYNIKAGEPIFLDINVSGEPAPEISWTQNGKSVYPTSASHIETVPYNTKYINSRPERKDTGLYKIAAHNLYGQDQVEFQINIISKYIFLWAYILYILFKSV